MRKGRLFPGETREIIISDRVQGGGGGGRGGGEGGGGLHFPGRQRGPLPDRKREIISS